MQHFTSIAIKQVLQDIAIQWKFIMFSTFNKKQFKISQIDLVSTLCFFITFKQNTQILH